MTRISRAYFMKYKTTSCDNFGLEADWDWELMPILSLDRNWYQDPNWWGKAERKDPGTLSSITDKAPSQVPRRPL